MNKSDLKLIVIVIASCLFVYLLTVLFEGNTDKQALVYYKNELVHTVDLTNHDYYSFSVMGENGLVDIESENGKIRVVNEISPLHLCSKQGWVDSSYTPIVCLPNNVIIKIVEKEDNLDAVVN
jgi:hypothetical protein